jgi:hypothetical protein
MTIKENKFKNGELVFERTNPYQKLMVSRYADRVYYCKIVDAPTRKELVYFERDLIADASATAAVPKEDSVKSGSIQFWSF